MALTTNGLPYPLGTDKVVDGDDAIKALAEKVDQLVLPQGYVRCRCITSSSHGAATWNVIPLDVVADARGSQPWTLEAAQRRLKLAKGGTYSLSASMTMSAAGFALGIGISADGVTWDRCAATQVGTTSFTSSVSTTRYIQANWYVGMLFYSGSVLTTSIDAVNSPSYLGVHALGGQV